MNIKATIKKLLIDAKHKINKLPLVRKIVVSLLSKFPNFYKRLQKLNHPSLQEAEKKVNFNSLESEKIYNDIKNILQ